MVEFSINPVLVEHATSTINLVKLAEDLRYEYAGLSDMKFGGGREGCVCPFGSLCIKH